MNKAIIYGGGTVNHIRPHLAISAPAYGSTAKYLEPLLKEKWNVELKLTKMAGGTLETNKDVLNDVKKIIKDPDVKLVIFSVALCDFEGLLVGDKETAFAKEKPRLNSSKRYLLELVPADKIIKTIRRERKDIFLVGFKTVAGVSKEEMFEKGLTLLKKNSCNLVFANDIKNRTNVVLTPEMGAYGFSEDRAETLGVLTNLIAARTNCTFTKTTENKYSTGLDWNDVPTTLKTVINYCINNNAYKPFLGTTVGHFGFRPAENILYSSRRKKNYNKIEDRDLVEVLFKNGMVFAKEKPSAGARSQYMILDDQYNCVVHFHCPLKPGHSDNIPSRTQFSYECGSHECGENTAAGLQEVRPGIKAVMLDKHGPNIVFSQSIDPRQVIDFIKDNFDLSKQAGLS